MLEVLARNQMEGVTADKPGIKIAAGSSEQAPFIYCDGVAFFGMNGGIVQLELAANTIMPEGTGTKTDVLITAHLRCNQAAAVAIRDAIDKALGMLSQQAAMEPIRGSKPN